MPATTRPPPEKRCVKVLREGSVFGEAALLEPLIAESPYSVHAGERGAQLWRLSATELAAVASDFPQLRPLLELHKERTRIGTCAFLGTQTELLDGESAELISDVADAVRRQHFLPKQLVVTQGTAGDGLCFVSGGEFRCLMLRPATTNTNAVTTNSNTATSTATAEGVPSVAAVKNHRGGGSGPATIVTDAAVTEASISSTSSEESEADRLGSLVSTIWTGWGELSSRVEALLLT